MQPGASARLRIDQASDGTISFGSDLGVAAEPSFGRYPAAYLHARYVHLGTAPPRQQLAWLKYLRDKGCHAQVSVDMFEPFVATEPGACHEVCDRADLIFLNEAEHRDLYRGRAHRRRRRSSSTDPAARSSSRMASGTGFPPLPPAKWTRSEPGRYSPDHFSPCGPGGWRRTGR